MPVHLAEVILRSRTGERMLEKDFDMSIFRAAEKLRREFELKYDRDNPVPSDDAMADRLFQAAIQFYAQVGTYCVDTGRAIRFTEQEIREALDAAPTSETLGEGNEQMQMVHRDVEGKQEPIIVAGVQTCIYSDDNMAFRIYKRCAEDKCVDGIWGGVVTKVDGKYDVIAGTPMEIFGYRRNVELMRRAVAAAGRPGLVIINNAPTSVATIAMYDPAKGMRRSDSCMSTGVSELKINYDDMDRVAYASGAGISMHGAQNSVIGGFSGSVEGATITCVAGAFQSLLVQQSQIVEASTVPFQVKSKCTRECLWVGSLALQALCRNTHLIVGGSMGDHPSAGPGTKQYLYEAAAGFIANVVSGGHHIAGTRKFTIGNTPDYGTPLESRWMGEVSKSAAGMKRTKANEIARYLLAKYEPNLRNAPAGGTYADLYDLDKDEPKPEYQRLYNEVKEELVGLGLEFRTW